MHCLSCQSLSFQNADGGAQLPAESLIHNGQSDTYSLQACCSVSHISLALIACLCKAVHVSGDTCLPYTARLHLLVASQAFRRPTNLSHVRHTLAQAVLSQRCPFQHVHQHPSVLTMHRDSGGLVRMADLRCQLMPFVNWTAAALRCPGDLHAAGLAGQGASAVSCSWHACTDFSEFH